MGARRADHRASEEARTMTPEDIDFDLRAGERAVRDLVHRYTEEVMRPAGRELDRLPAEDVIAGNSIPWNVHAKCEKLGVRRFGDSGADLTPVQAARLSCLGTEEDGIRGETGHFYFGEDRTSVLWAYNPWGQWRTGP
jgi:hypothetical protein